MVIPTIIAAQEMILPHNTWVLDDGRDPDLAEACRRIPARPTILGDWSDHATAQKLSDKNLDRLGFTKYQKAGDGLYEKKAGKGPNQIINE